MLLTSQEPRRPLSAAKKFVFSLVLSCAAIMVMTVAAELLCWLLSPFSPLTDERNLTYHYHPTLGWFPVPDSEHSFFGSRRILVKHNHHGFRDHEHGIKQSPRIMFLGDSFVWGYDAEQTERFTERLQQRLPGWEVLNLGISGYGTDQELLLLRQIFDDYLPDVVVVVFCLYNDREDNRSNVRYGGYYKPYFVVEDGALVLHGVPVPRSPKFSYPTRPVIFSSYLVTLFEQTARNSRNLVETLRGAGRPDPTWRILTAMKSFLAERGVRFFIASTGSDGVDSAKPVEEELARFATAQRIPFVALRGEKYPKISHWTPAGHLAVSNQLYDFLGAQVLPSWPGPAVGPAGP